MAMDKTTTSILVGSLVGAAAYGVGGASIGTSVLIGGIGAAGTWVALDAASASAAEAENLEKELKGARRDLSDMKLKVDGFIDDAAAEKKKAKKAAKRRPVAA
jgi:hypothetical protein